MQLVTNNEQSSKDLGWAIRQIKFVNGDSVTLNDGVSFDSPCFQGAVAGDIWAVNHVPGLSCFGAVKQAILLKPAGRGSSF